MKTEKPKKKRIVKKELRIYFDPEHYERLERQAGRLDQTTAALVRMWALREVGVLEALGAQSGAVDLMRIMQQLTEKPFEQEDQQK